MGALSDVAAAMTAIVKSLARWLIAITVGVVGVGWLFMPWRAV